ncbi:MAG TPA: glycoside hydrolase family 3 C-terminal domain-containing protein [Planctomycetota bacterium]|nr:glycoside hydrolase family 3 C-terminal domain-containing protein [Planctomycetota bacterium]
MKQLMLLFVFASSVVFGGDAAVGTPQTELWRDAGQPIDRRVDDLVGRMTLQEKIAQTMMDAPVIERLGIPAYHWWNEALHGVARAGHATVFPQAIGLAATWNTDLHGQIADVISTEARAKHNEYARQNSRTIYHGLTLWSPNVNIFRDPRWGRGHETYGEDPYLTGRFGVAFVRGIQGNDPQFLKAIATPKHFAVHSGPEPLRHGFDPTISPRDLWETYLPAFEACIREGKAYSTMAAYNGFNGVPCTGNPVLLTTLLRQQWGFEGCVVSDVDSVGDIWKGHKLAKDAAEASAMAIKAGDDLCSGTTYKGLDEALKRGLIQEADIDRAVKNLFRARFKLGFFDTPERCAYQRIPFSENCKPEHDRLALEAARQSLVLLKNDGILPLREEGLKTVAVLGPTADNTQAVLGNYFGIPVEPVTILNGLRKRLEPRGVKVLHEGLVPLVDGFRGNFLPLPTDALYSDESKKTAGLTCEFFDNLELKGTPHSLRVNDADLFWNRDKRLPAMPIGQCSMRLSGAVVPSSSGEYVLRATGDGAVRLWFDGKQVVDKWTKAGTKTESVALTLEAGRAYPIRVEYFQSGDSGMLRLDWKTPHSANPIQRATDLAQQADLVILTLGITPELEGEEMKVDAEGFNGGDRTTLALPISQQKLLDAIAATGKPTVLVLTGGSALAVDDSRVGAVLLAWYYGQRGGDAVAEALFGQYNPGGRLPVTFYRSVADLPPFADYAMNGRTYRYFKGPVKYPFGYGLSYTRFNYEKLRITPTQADQPAPVRVTVDVVNAGQRAGDEVVQLYVTPPPGAPTTLIHHLEAFRRVRLQPGEKRTVTFELAPRQLTYVNDKGERVWGGGAVGISVGGGQPGHTAGVLSSSVLTGSAQVEARPAAFGAKPAQ